MTKCSVCKGSREQCAPHPRSWRTSVVSGLLCQTLQEPQAICSATCLLRWPGLGNIDPFVHPASATCQAREADGAEHAAWSERETRRRRVGLGAARGRGLRGPARPRGARTSLGEPELGVGCEGRVPLAGGKELAFIGCDEPETLRPIYSEGGNTQHRFLSACCIRIIRTSQ